jgi:hypothetical protein
MSKDRLVHVLLVALLLVATIPASATSRSRQWAIIDIWDPTLIGETIVRGPVLFVHDDAKALRGEPCTSVQLFDPAVGPVLEVASFHCIPKPRPVVSRFTVTTRVNAELGYGCVLTEFQFAGETEGHLVPEIRLAEQ